jgi:hypothetical protein
MPLVATRPEASEVIDQVASASQPFGTEIEIDDGVGVVRLRDG